MSNSSGSRSVSPKTPVGRPGAGRPDDYFAPKIASEYDSTPPQQPRRPGGYGGFSDPDGFGGDSMYPASSPRKPPADFMARMNSLAPGPFEANRRPGIGARNAFPSRGGDMSSSDEDRSDFSKGRYANDRPSTSASMRSNGSGNGNGNGNGGVAPPRVPKKDSYGGFGPRQQRPDDFEPQLSRAGTFPRQSEATDAPLRTPSAPGPRPERLRKPSNAAPIDMPMLPPRTPRSRRPSMGPDTSRPPPPRTSIVRPRTSGRDTPSINIAAEFGIGNPYHTPTVSMSSSASSYSRPSQASSQSSPERSTGARLTRKPSKNNFNNFDNLMSDLQAMSQTKPPPPPPSTDKPMSLRNRRQPPSSDDRYDPIAQEQERQSRSRSRSRPPLRSPSWDAARRGEPPMPGSQRDYSPKTSAAAVPGGSDVSERRTRSRSRGRDPNGVPSRGICKACGDPISGKSISSADGQLTGRYHKACFVCTTCTAPFSTSTFYVFDDKPYCERHYHEANGSVCSSCGDGIEGQYLADQGDKKFHPECFICSDCGDVLRDGYFEVNGKPYCEKDAWKRVQMAGRPGSRNGGGPGPGLGPGSATGGAPRGLPSAPGAGFGLPSRPGAGFGLPSGNRLAPGVGFGPRPRMEKRMTRLGMM